MNTATVRQPML